MAGPGGGRAAWRTPRRASCSTLRSRRASPSGCWPPRPGTRWRCWRSPGCSPPRSSPGASRSRTRCGPGTGVESAFAAAVDALPEATQRALLLAAAAGTRRLDALPVGGPRAGRERADRDAGRGRARVPPSADALDRLSPGVARPTGARRTRRWPRRRSGAERAWHLAACAVAPDEAVASALEQAALDARDRGAYATSARDLHRAAQLTPDDGERARRLLAAAGDAIRCGEAERAGGLLDEAAALSDDPLLAADVARLKGHVEMRRGSPVAANEQLVREAERVRGARPPPRGVDVPRGVRRAPDDRRLLRRWPRSAERARALSTGVDPAVELLATALVGEAQIALGEVAQGVAELRACEPYLMEADPLAMVEIVGMAAFAWVWVEDFERASRLLARVLTAARNASAVTALIHPLAVQAHLDLRRGRWAAALAGATEAAELADDAGPARPAPPRVGGAGPGRGGARPRDRLPRARRTRSGAVRRRLLPRRARTPRARARPHPGGDRGAGGR